MKITLSGSFWQTKNMTGEFFSGLIPKKKIKIQRAKGKFIISVYVLDKT